MRDLFVNSSPLVGRSPDLALLGLRVGLIEEGELHLHTVVDVLVVLEDHIVVKVGIFLMAPNPIGLQLL